jgi:restriction system protein
MPRRKKQSPIENLVDLLALLPWWVCLVLAVLSYAVLSALARSAPLAAVQPGQIGQATAHSIFAALAMAGQYLVPLACLLAALGSAVGRRHRSNLVSRTAAGGGSEVLEGMTWREFEMLMGEAFRLQGFQVTELGGEGPDGGIDLVLRKGGEKFLVQCKQWKAFNVGVQTVRELYGVMAAEHATGGFVVTSGRFSDDAIEFARGRNVTLLDGPKVFELIKQARKRSTAATSSAPIRPLPKESRAQAATEAPPSCPECSRKMIPRTAKRGGNVGRSFWGCPSYPKCRGTLRGPAA